MKTNKELLKEAKRRYIKAYLILAPAQLAAVLFPLAWVMRKLGKKSPLWFVLDDTRLDSTTESGYSEDYRIYLRDFKIGFLKNTPRWIKVLAWHTTRNRVWNLQEKYRVPQYKGEDGNQRIHVMEMYKDGLFQKLCPECTLSHVKQDGVWAIGAGLKYIPQHPDDDPYQVNRGDYINHKTSIMGKGYFLYRDDQDPDFVSFRFTDCVIVKPWWLFGGERWRTRFFGTNANRYAFKWKYQKTKPWK